MKVKRIISAALIVLCTTFTAGAICKAACDTCDGSKMCHVCEGSGQAVTGSGACAICDGGKYCTVCEGTGKF